MNLTSKEEFLSSIKKEIQDETLVLPTFPEVALKAREAANNESTTAEQLATIINTDAALSARIKSSQFPSF